MNKKIITMGIIPLICIAGWVTATWQKGTEIEDSSNAHFQQVNTLIEKEFNGLIAINPEAKHLLAELGFVNAPQVEVIQYNRGIFTSTAQYKIKNIPFDIVYAAEIEHGPFPPSAVSQGYFSPKFSFTTIKLAESPLSRDIKANLSNNEEPLVSTILIENNSKDMHINNYIAPMKGSISFVTIDSSPITASSSISGDLSNVQSQLKWDSFALSFMGISGIKFTNINADSNIIYSDIPLPIGLHKFSVQRIESFGVIAAFAGIPLFSLNDIQISNQTDIIQENKINYFVKQQIGEVRVGDHIFGSMVFNFSLENLYIPSLISIKDIFYDAIQKNERDFDESHLENLRSVFTQFLAEKPLLKITDFAVENSFGKSNLTGVYKLKAVEKWNETDFGLKDLLQITEFFDLNISLSKPMLTELIAQQIVLASKNKTSKKEAYITVTEDMEHAIANINDQLVIKTDDNLTFSFKYADGIFNLNGKELSLEELQNIDAANDTFADEDDAFELDMLEPTITEEDIISNKLTDDQPLPSIVQEESELAENSQL